MKRLQVFNRLGKHLARQTTAPHSNVENFFTGRDEQVDLVPNNDLFEGLEKGGGPLAR